MLHLPPFRYILNSAALYAGPAVPPITYATLDGTPSNVTLSNGNRTVAKSGSALGGARSTSLKSSGKYYFEVTVNTGSSADAFGIATAAATYSNMVNDGTNGTYVYHNSGNIYSNNGGSGFGIGSFTVAGTVLAVAIDHDNHRAWFRIVSGTPGNWNGSGTANPATNTGGAVVASAAMAPIYGAYADVSARNFTYNCGQSAFTGTVPSGFTTGWTV